MTDYDQILFFNEGLRGGFSFIGHQYARANIPKTKYYDPNKPEKVIIPFDAANLYGKQ